MANKTIKTIDKTDLVELVISDIENDIKAGDTTAVEELLMSSAIPDLLAYLPETVSTKLSVNQDSGIIIVRYSGNQGGWMSLYKNKNIAIKHIIDNINIHFGEVATEDELSDYHTEATRAITEGDVCAEFDSLNIEIEYGAELQD